MQSENLNKQLVAILGGGGLRIPGPPGRLGLSQLILKGQLSGGENHHKIPLLGAYFSPHCWEVLLFVLQRGESPFVSELCVT